MVVEKCTPELILGQLKIGHRGTESFQEGVCQSGGEADTVLLEVLVEAGLGYGRRVGIRVGNFFEDQVDVEDLTAAANLFEDRGLDLGEEN